MFQGTAVLFIFFVSLKKAPQFVTNPIAQQKYLKVMRTIVAFLCAGILIIVPVIVILLAAFQLPNSSEKLSANYFVLCIVLQVLFLVRVSRSDGQWIQ